MTIKKINNQTMKKVLFCAAISGLLFLSCSKSDDNTVPEVEKYMSLTAGSKWTYDIITNPGTPGETIVPDTVTCTSTDTTVEAGTSNERIYRIMKHSNGNTSDYYNISGTDYYRFQMLPLDNLKIQDLYLKENAAVGTEWQQTLPVNVPGIPLPVPITVTNKVTQKDIIKTVKGIEYKNVILITTTITSSSLPAGTIVTDIRSYYAPKVGLIEGDYMVEVALAAIDLNTQTLLKTAVIL